MRDILLTLFLQTLAVQPALPAPGEPELVLAAVGRFAVFADRSSLERDGDAAGLRTLQVAPEGFEAGGRPYVGGWSNWRFDCTARTVQRLDFSSVAEDGTEGPATPLTAPPRPAGDDEMLLLDIACGATSAEPRAEPGGIGSIAEAIIQGRARLAQGAEPTF